MNIIMKNIWVIFMFFKYKRVINENLLQKKKKMLGYKMLT
jgi:hypothetical protein